MIMLPVVVAGIAGSKQLCVAAVCDYCENSRWTHGSFLMQSAPSARGRRPTSPRVGAI
jgi:hypothetical protein